jgi:CheY-like chemotaxis protein
LRSFVAAAGMCSLGEALTAISGSDGAATCPILALTAFGAVGQREKALAAGFDGFFSKPITPGTFMDQLEAFFGGEDRRGAPA